MAVAKDCMEMKSINPLWLFVMAGIGAGCYVGLHLNLFSLSWAFVPALLYTLIVLMRLMSFPIHDRVLDFLGDISLESYLTNVTLGTIFVTLIPAYINSPLFYGRYLEYFLTVVLGLLLSVCVNKASKRALKCVKR